MKHPSFPALLTLACLMVAPSLTAQRRYQSKPPVPAALLGIVPTVQSQLAGRSSSVNACSVQGTGSLSAPYQLVQVPGFDCARDPNTSPWQALRLHEMDENKIDWRFNNHSQTHHGWALGPGVTATAYKESSDRRSTLSMLST